MRTRFSMTRGGSRTAAKSKMELFLIIVNDQKPFNYYQKVLHLGCSSSPGSASDRLKFITCVKLCQQLLLKKRNEVKKSINISLSS